MGAASREIVQVECPACHARGETYRYLANVRITCLTCWKEVVRIIVKPAKEEQ